MAVKKMWGGRFNAVSPEFAQEFGASIDFDQAMAAEDIEGSIAHVTMLGDTGILSQDEAATIKHGLQELSEELTQGGLELTVANEDIHMNIEALLTAKIGPLAGKLHTARSRNDQVATDFHLWVQHRLPEVIASLKKLQVVLVHQAEQHVETILPGTTHLQHAQPISLGHYFMAYFNMLQRDVERFDFNQQHTSISPLGAAALAGTTFPIDRQETAELLGFQHVYTNSLDAVSDRDFAIEYLANASMLMMHLSRLCEELVLWSSYEYQYVEMDDAYATGSSIMPQKKNPDYAELIRGKVGRVYGDLTGLLTVMKGLPLAYNKDMQEDKEGVFDATTTIMGSLHVMTGMLTTLHIKADRMGDAVKADFSNATELADYLAAKGLPFRQAHAIVGQLVLMGIQTNTPLQDMPLATLQAASPLITADVYHDLDPVMAVERRQSLGGTGFDSVRQQVATGKQLLGDAYAGTTVD
ncbi:argininosuccinate lyase [Lacticaseibacillus thailandensis]|uniref:Argininosuccinate lyase n=1 Tax=Lacticaseibacillus thailandensis DSM 22698 = JCM 13996 TaxID=1423810 RepID=A0A0R2CF94_9LACO|nr:argininosuccinate lyase [Lacticaseibacillus thailandensis]KRM86844.1 argininosuccinate lyase [Lacticaseibacillus thailandensis DSM 22698 = JCM 13996]